VRLWHRLRLSVRPTYGGQVVDIETGTPLAGTFVVATYEVPQIIHGHRCAHGEVTRTDKEGRFSLKGMPLSDGVGHMSSSSSWGFYHRGYSFVEGKVMNRILMKRDAGSSRFDELRRLNRSLGCVMPFDGLSEVYVLIAQEAADLASSPEEKEFASFMAKRGPDEANRVKRYKDLTGKGK
jgi:hypothetical protein